MCNVYCIELSHAQVQTTIQALISHVTHCGSILYIHNFPVHFVVNSSFYFEFILSKFLHITYPLPLYVRAMEKNTLINPMGGWALLGVSEPASAQTSHSASHSTPLHTLPNPSLFMTISLLVCCRLTLVCACNPWTLGLSTHKWYGHAPQSSPTGRGPTVAGVCR